MAFEFISRPEPEQIYRALKDVIDAVLTGNAHYRELVEEVVQLETELVQKAGKEAFAPYERKMRDLQALALEMMFRAGFIFGKNLTSLEKELDQLKKAR
jgi:hypothetical protein